jgi:rhomboid protease GluP
MEPEELVPCRYCGASNSQEAAICTHCGAPVRDAPPAVRPAPVALLPLPIMRGVTWVSWLLLGINVVVWLAMTAAGGSTKSEVLLSFGAKYGPAILAGEYWRLFTTMFLHIGLMHLGFNSYALYALGPEMERFFGRVRFLTIYLLAGLLSSAVSYLISSNLAAGASGAIFGLVGALSAFFIHEQEVLGTLGRRRLNSLVSVVVINLIIGFTAPNIDNAAHIGGLVAGFLIGWLLTPEYEVVPRSPTSPPHVVDANSLSRRWWVVPAALVAAVGLTLLGNVREGSTAAARARSGESHLERGEWEEAIVEFTAALEKDPQLWTAYIYRAEAYLQVDDMDAALDDFETVIERGSTMQVRAVAYTGRGRVFMLRGQRDQALDDLDMAVRLAPEEPFSRFVRGLIYREIGESSSAVQELEAALSLGLPDERSVAIVREALEELGE